MKTIERLLKTMVLRTLPGTTITSCNFEGRVCDMTVSHPGREGTTKISFLLSERSDTDWQNNSWLGFSSEEVENTRATKPEGADEAFYVMHDPSARKGIFVRVLPEMDYTCLFDRSDPTISIVLSCEFADILNEDGERTFGIAHKMCSKHAHRI